MRLFQSILFITYRTHINQWQALYKVSANFINYCLFFYKNLMMHPEEQVIEIPFLEIFDQSNWSTLLPKKYLIKSKTFQIDQNDTQFFIDDCTNPDYNQLSINQNLNQTINNELNQAAFLKIYGRTAKDINHTMSKILNSQDLTMAIKMSQFLTEALDQQLEAQIMQSKQNSTPIKLKIILRQYKNYLENPTNQFRFYFLNESLIAVSQKVPNHIGSPANEFQMTKGQQIGKAVNSAIEKIFVKNEIKGQKTDSEFVVDCFINESGSKGKILSIEPIKPLHCLCLFSEEEITQLYSQAKSSMKQNKCVKAQIRHVKRAEQFKQVDLSYYRVGWELGQGDNLQEWKQFIKEK